MFLRGWILGWMIQLAAAAVLWLPLAIISGWQGSWDRAWIIGGTVRLWVCVASWAALGLLLLLALLGHAENAIRVGPDVRDRLTAPATTRTAGAPGEGTIPTVADTNASDASVVHVYDYTTTSASYWTPIIISTVDEFNAVRPDTAPHLVYSAESGSFDCLDLPRPVANLAGIIICDTSRPGEFPYNPNAPREGWAGMEGRIDDDTTRIVLNSFVPEGYYQDADNTVCHEMMHAYTLVDDNYDSDVNSCVFGDLLSPGTTDIRLMKERWTATVSEPSRRERASDVTPDVGIPIPAENPTVSARAGCDPAYPDARTCIPPGPPFNQGCAITNEREFTVLPPDPQRLDRDQDGIGCEPFPSG